MHRKAWTNFTRSIRRPHESSKLPYSCNYHGSNSKILPSTRRKNMSKQFCTQETSCLDRGVMSGMHAVYTFSHTKTFLYSPASRNTSTATEPFRKLTNHNDVMTEASFISHGHDSALTQLMTQQ